MEVRLLIFDTDDNIQLMALAELPFYTTKRVCEWKRIYGRITLKVIVDLTEATRKIPLWLRK